jgi:hypothetical protein
VGRNGRFPGHGAELQAQEFYEKSPEEEENQEASRPLPEGSQIPLGHPEDSRWEQEWEEEEADEE